MFSWFKRKPAPTEQSAVASAAQAAAPSRSSANHQERGDRYLEAGNREAAVACYEKALSVNPSHAEVHASLGDAYRAQGQADRAERCYRQALLLKPALSSIACNLAALLLEQVRGEEAIAILEQARELQPNAEIIYCDLCHALFQAGRLDAARQVIAEGIALNANYARFHFYQGNLHNHEADFDKAIASYERALSIQPDYAEVRINLGRMYQAKGLLTDAADCFQQALVLDPANPALHCEFGQALQKQGALEAAADAYRAALRVNPDWADAHFNLGTVCMARGNPEAAGLCFDEALYLSPGNADAHYNYSGALYAQGRWDEALSSCQRALELTDKYEYRRRFFQCLARVTFTSDVPERRPFVIRALTEPWGTPAEIMGAVCSLIKLNPEINGCIERAVHAWPARLNATELFGHAGLRAVAGDGLLKCLLLNTHNRYLDMERFLSQCRSVMLAHATEDEKGFQTTDASDVSNAADAVEFYCAVAQQCFIVEYVFDHGDAEYRQASGLRDDLVLALKSGCPVSAMHLIAVAAYFPLFSLPGTELLLERPWPEFVNALLAQQIREPMEERRLREDIPRLTTIEDDVSCLVQQQYEENPYPRWVRSPRMERAMDVDDFLHTQFPRAPIQPLAKRDALEVLIAGCGTGQHPIGTAQQFRGARVLAVDLSLSSLAYAKRKVREMRLGNLEFVQADIMGLGALNRSFDLIESVGVLHHMADPLSGWKILLSLLRPGGVMCLGFYSERGRAEVVAARNFIAAKGYAPSAESMRRCRQELMSSENMAQFRILSMSPDFYGMSACRDLIFHFQEHRYTPAQLKVYLTELELEFLGFTIDPAIAKLYDERFPDDAARTNLDNWDRFEAATPFTGMYEFWVQKRTAEPVTTL